MKARLRSQLLSWIEVVRARRGETCRARLLESYLRSDRRPWSAGYLLYRAAFLEKTISDVDTMRLFRDNALLPPRYGFALDDRVVEYPWLVSRIQPGAGRLLDAGGVLNHQFAIGWKPICEKNITIATLAPESACLCSSHVSYSYTDLRELPFRDGWFDEVCCVSTIEHVGMDNSLYIPGERYREAQTDDFQRAAAELRRVTRSGGKLYFTVPFGRYINYGWYQQFDSEYADRLIDALQPTTLAETVFRYTPEGWVRSSREECRDVEGFDVQRTKYFDPRSDKDFDADFAAGSRAVIALECTR